MKNRLLLCLFLLGSIMVNAQVVLTEDFSGTFPPSGWSIDAHAANWTAENSAAAGGVAPEAFMSWSPQFNGATRLISPELNMTGESTLLLQFRQFIDHYDGSYQIGVATRSNGGAWTNAWTATITDPVPASIVNVPISDANVNSATFQFCIFFSGNSYNINSWQLDDIQVLIPAEVDGSVSALNVPTYFLGASDVKGTFTNVGTTPVESFRINWNLDGGAVNSDLISGQNITLGQAVNFTSSTQVAPAAGVHSLSVWVTEVNGLTTGDDNTANDTLSKTLRIPSQTIAKTPMFEEFTSSTCSPCKTFNNTIFTPFLNQNEDQLVYVKYQMNWPGAGDPYYTAEGGSRRNYYGVNAVPMLYVDGMNVSTASSAAINAAFNTSLATPAFVQIDSYYAIDGNNIIVKGQFLSFVELADATLHIVVYENLTTGNVATNGETEFHHVMMKMLPDGNGQAIPLVGQGQAFLIDHLFDMSSTNVEEMSDLSVAVFLQDDETKEVFQAAYADLSGVGVKANELSKLTIYPNPVSDKINIVLPSASGDNYTLQMFDGRGQMVYETTILQSGNVYSFDNNFRNGVYNVRLISNSQYHTGKFISTK